jgi:hypothetical protein
MRSAECINSAAGHNNHGKYELARQNGTRRENLIWVNRKCLRYWS